MDTTILKNMLTDFLEKLNNGNKFSRDDIEINYKNIQPFIDLLYTVDDFPVDHSDENIYCFMDFKRKHFDKYHIHDIADIVINYNEDVKSYTSNPVKIITDYAKNKSNSSEHISWIVNKYASGQSCSDSKKIKQIIWGNRTKEKGYNKAALTEKILKYATDIKHREVIAKIIIDIKRHKHFSTEIHDIVKESKLPRRDNEAYQIISSYEPYELTHCISYEMASRNQDVKNLLKSIHNLIILSKKLFEYYTIYNDAEIEDNPYFDLQNIIEKALQLLSQHEIKHDINIKFHNFKLFETHSAVMQMTTQLIMILEEEYYMIYDRKEIMPEGMEEVFKEPNHHEHDRELNQYMDKAIEASIRNAYDSSPRYKDNFTFKDGYAVYQASYEDSKEYDINKIFPNFKRPMREFNQTQVAFNMSLPKDEIIAYIEKIKDDYDSKNTSYKTLNQLLYGDNTRTEDKLNHKQKKRYADDFFIYDYYTQSDENHEKKLELIQKKLSQYHGMKIKRARNDYELVNYDEANNKQHNSKQTSYSTLDELKMSFKNDQHAIQYLTIDIIKTRYTKMQDSIDGKKYKTLICH